MYQRVNYSLFIIGGITINKLMIKDYLIFLNVKIKH